MTPYGAHEDAPLTADDRPYERLVAREGRFVEVHMADLKLFRIDDNTAEELSGRSVALE
jgi:hypothetical protein